jgi:uncharacterized protein YjdB
MSCTGNSPSSIEVEPARRLLTKKGATLQLKTTVKDKKGNLLTGVKVSYKSLTPTMAFVNSSGVVSAVTSGNATLMIQAGKLTKQVDVLIQIAKKIKITPSNPLMMVGVTRAFRGTVIDDRDSPIIAGKITWSSSDPTVFSVDQHGNVKTLKEGKAMLIAKAAGIQDSTEILVKHEEIHEDGTLSQ